MFLQFRSRVMNVFRRDSLRAFGSKRSRRKTGCPPVAVIEEIISRAIIVKILKPPHN